MASELRVNTLKDAAGNNSIATSFVAGGSAKAWVEFDHTTNTLNNSLNVSSVADNETGKFTPSYTNAFSSATDYSCVGMPRSYHMIVDTDSSSKVAGSTKLRTWYVSNTAGGRTNLDVYHNSVTCNGDLA